jgi:hypothetical protein
LHRYTADELAALVEQTITPSLAVSFDSLKQLLVGKGKPVDLADDRRMGADDFWSFAQLVIEDELEAMLLAQRKT